MSIGSSFVRALITVGATLGVASCGTLPAYEGVPAGQPAAELRLLKSYGDAGFAGSALQGYSLSTDETCKTTRDAATFSWTTGDEKVVRVAPDKPILVWASTNYFRGDTIKSCVSVMRFTPQSGHAYDVSQPTTTVSPGCAATIIDRATGVSPPWTEFVRARACVEEGKVAKG